MNAMCDPCALLVDFQLLKLSQLRLQLSFLFTKFTAIAALSHEAHFRTIKCCSREVLLPEKEAAA